MICTLIKILLNMAEREGKTFFFDGGQEEALQFTVQD